MAIFDQDAISGEFATRSVTGPNARALAENCVGVPVSFATSRNHCIVVARRFRIGTGAAPDPASDCHLYAAYAIDADESTIDAWKAQGHIQGIKPLYDERGIIQNPEEADIFDNNGDAKPAIRHRNDLALKALLKQLSRLAASGGSLGEWRADDLSASYKALKPESADTATVSKKNFAAWLDGAKTRLTL